MTSIVGLYLSCIFSTLKAEVPWSGG